MNGLDLLGYASATLTTAAFVPQVLLTYKRRKAEGVSLGMYIVFVVGLIGWLAYGVLIESWPMIVSNIVTISLAGFILAMKLRFG
jgi:MtN3 and saliva related transmembrane protein